MGKSGLSESKKSQIHETLQHEIFRVTGQVADQRNQQAFVIGGYVRDLLLDRPCKDIDIVVVGSGIDLAKAVAKKLGDLQVNYFTNFGTAMFRYQDFEVEFVGARKESYDRGSRKPVVEDGTLEDDQNRRDFTINAMALSLNKESYGALLDPFGGQEDLKLKRIRTPLDPEITFSDDPLRMMRAIRFATQLNFIIDARSLEGITATCERIDIVSMERVTGELNLIIASKKPSIGFYLLQQTGLLPRFFPEFSNLGGIEMREGQGHKDNFVHTLTVLDNIAENTDNLFLRWAAILHDIAKPATKRYSKTSGWTFHGHEDKGARMVPAIFKRLRLPLDQKMKYVQKLVALHLRPIALTKEEATDSAVRRLMFEAGEDIDDLMILCQADITSKNEKKVRQYLINYEKVMVKIQEVEQKDKIRNWQPPITGEEIMKAFKLPPGPFVGVIKTAIREAIIEGEIGNDHDAAFQFMLLKGKELGLSRA